MANWDVLKSAIAGIIKTNGNQEITGQLLQNVLNNIVSSVGENATFVGIASPSTNPGVPDGPVFYLATAPGIYPNFGGAELVEGEAVILEWSDGAWAKKVSGFATQQNLTKIEYKDTVVYGYVPSGGNKGIFTQSGSGDYLTAIRKVEPGQKLIIYTDAIYLGYDSLAAFTDSEVPLTGLKLAPEEQTSAGNNIRLKIGYNEITVPDGAAYFYMTLKFADSLGLPENKIIASYSDYAALQKIRSLENSAKEVENLNTSIAGLQQADVEFQRIIGGARKAKGEVYKGHVTAGATQWVFTPTDDSEDYLTYFLRVTPGEQLVIFTDQVYTPTYDLAVFSADSEINIAQKLGSNVRLQNGWNTITVPEGAQSFSMTLKFANSLGLPENKIIASYSDCAMAQKIQALETVAPIMKKGYITSGGISTFFNVDSSDKYLTYFLSVRPGEQIVVYTDALYSGYDSLAAFTDAPVPTGAKKIGGNTPLKVGWNTIIVPEGAQLFGMTVKFADSLGSPENKIVAKAPELGILKKVQNLEASIASINREQKPIRILRKDGYVYVSTRLSEAEDLTQRIFFDNTEGNKNINLIDSYLTQAGTTNQTRFIKTCGDDICPAHVNGSYIGGNHGWNSAKKLTAAEHGKTVADIGSTYQDEAGIIFYLIGVEDTNTLIVHSQNLNTDGTYRFSSPSGPLSYISNGNNTSDITFTSVEGMGNVYGFINPSDKKILIDGVALQKDGVFYADEIALIEHYDIYDLPSTLSAIVNNRPEGGYTSAPAFWSLPGAEVLFTHVVSYSFDKRGGMKVGTTLIPQKKLTLSFHGITQAQVISNAKSLYCPKTKAKQVGDKIYDLNKLADWSVAPSASIIINPPYYADPQSPPDRAVMRNDFMSFACGYMLDRGVLVNRKNMVSNYAMNFASTRKLYPMGVCEGAVLQPGEAFSAVAYRTYYCQENQPSQRTNYSIVELKEKVRIFVDYHGSIIDYLPTDNAWNGCKMTVVEKNDKCQLIGDIVTGDIMIISTATESENGYIVIDVE